jgi:hypothetical protein
LDLVKFAGREALVAGALEVIMVQDCFIGSIEHFASTIGDFELKKNLKRLWNKNR